MRITKILFLIIKLKACVAVDVIKYDDGLTCGAFGNIRLENTL